MGKILRLLLFACMLISTSSVFAQKTITIKGKVKFPYNRFNMEIVERQGFDKTIIDSCKVKDDGTYEFKMKVDKPGVYTLDCQKWQSVQFWAEDEDLEINFRGEDTAKIKIKNPPYVYINGGPNNEVMNLMNWDGYRGYQLMIGVSQGVYRIPGIDDQAKQEVSGKFYDMLGNESRARMRFLAEHYADRNSVLAVLPSLRGEENEELVQQVLARLESKNPNYAPLLKYKAEMAEAKAQKERLSEGKVAPEFSFPTPDGKKKLGPQDFKGKILVLDFWASWCGPCRAENPNVRKIYRKYKDAGLEIVSVSFDTKKEAWIRAIQEDKLNWIHLSDLKGWSSIASNLYEVHGIPYVFVLDENNRIIAESLRGEALEECIVAALKGTE